MTEDDARHGTNAGYAAHLQHGTPTCPPCRRAHARAIRDYEYAKHTGRPLALPAHGVHRRIQALQRLGWTQDQIAQACGWKHTRNLRCVMSVQRVQLKTWRRVARAYEKLSMSLPPAGTWATRTRNTAQRNGWPPPLAWDDIDDPNEQPHRVTARDNRKRQTEVDPAVVERVLSGEVMHTTRAEKDAIMRRWVAQGRSRASLAERMGWKDDRYGREEVA